MLHYLMLVPSKFNRITPAHSLVVYTCAADVGKGLTVRRPVGLNNCTVILVVRQANWLDATEPEIHHPQHQLFI